MEFRVREDYYDPVYDMCGNTCHAIIEINNMKFPLCEKCINDLRNGLNIFDSTIFCHKCTYFIMSESGWRYGGSCQLKASKDGKTVTKENAGYNYCVGCLDTCSEVSVKK